MTKTKAAKAPKASKAAKAPKASKAAGENTAAVTAPAETVAVKTERDHHEKTALAGPIIESDGSVRKGMDIYGRSTK